MHRFVHESRDLVADSLAHGQPVQLTQNGRDVIAPEGARDQPCRRILNNFLLSDLTIFSYHLAARLHLSHQSWCRHRRRVIDVRPRLIADPHMLFPAASDSRGASLTRSELDEDTR